MLRIKHKYLNSLIIICKCTDLSRDQVVLKENDDPNDIRAQFMQISIVNGDIIKSHLVCNKCLTPFHILDKNGHKTGQSTLKRHLSNCIESDNYNKKRQPTIEHHGQLAKQSNFFAIIIF